MRVLYLNQGACFFATAYLPEDQIEVPGWSHASYTPAAVLKAFSIVSAAQLGVAAAIDGMSKDGMTYAAAARVADEMHEKIMGILDRIDATLAADSGAMNPSQIRYQKEARALCGHVATTLVTAKRLRSV